MGLEVTDYNIRKTALYIVKDALFEYPIEALFYAIEHDYSVIIDDTVTSLVNKCTDTLRESFPQFQGVIYTITFDKLIREEIYSRYCDSVEYSDDKGEKEKSIVFQLKMTDHEYKAIVSKDMLSNNHADDEAFEIFEDIKSKLKSGKTTLIDCESYLSSAFSDYAYCDDEIANFLASKIVKLSPKLFCNVYESLLKDKVFLGYKNVQFLYNKDRYDICQIVAYKLFIDGGKAKLYDQAEIFTFTSNDLFINKFDNFLAE
jgi:hypothetical protein